jgi:hypothetical protein
MNKITLINKEAEIKIIEFNIEEEAEFSFMGVIELKKKIGYFAK